MLCFLRRIHASGVCRLGWSHAPVQTNKASLHLHLLSILFHMSAVILPSLERQRCPLALARPLRAPVKSQPLRPADASEAVLPGGWPRLRRMTSMHVPAAPMTILCSPAVLALQATLSLMAPCVRLHTRCSEGRQTRPLAAPRRAAASPAGAQQRVKSANMRIGSNARHAGCAKSPLSPWPP